MRVMIHDMIHGINFLECNDVNAFTGCLVIQLGCNLRGSLPLRIQDSHVRRELVQEMIPDGLNLQPQCQCNVNKVLATSTM